MVLLVVVLLAATGMAKLGEWQLSRARDRGGDAQREAVARPAVPLAGVLAPQTTFPSSALDRRVTTQGRWDGDRQVLVAGRVQDGRPGFWVLTPLQVDGADLAVVRGWTASASDPAASPALLPSGTVQVEGLLRPGEPAADRTPGSGSSLPAGQVDRIDFAALVQQWPSPLYSGYLVATAQSPAPAPPAGGTAAAGLAAVPPVSGGGGLNLQNLSYAFQWWLFALFGLFLWLRLVRDDHRGLLGTRRDADLADERADADPADQPADAVRDDEPAQPAVPGAHP